MAANQYYDTVQQIYIAYYGRPADPEGLAYWADRLDKVNGNLAEIIDAFGNSAEAIELYGSEGAAARINKVYMQLFGREADAEGLAFYTQQIESGKITLASVMLDVLNGAQNEDKAILNNKEAIAHAFTAHLNEAKEVNAYAGNAAANTVRDFMSGVSKDNLNEKQLNIDPVIVKLVGGNAAPTPGIVTLTADTDSLTGTYFKAPVGYTPGGNDRVNTLQDEDTLIGTGGNATLDVTLGTPNDNGASIVTPKMVDVRTINAEFSSSVSSMELNLQDAQGVQYVNVNRISGTGNSATIGDMKSIPLNMTLNNTSASTNTVTFDFAAHTLDKKSNGTDPAAEGFSDGDVSSITINNADVDNLVIGEVDKGLNFLEKLRVDSAGSMSPNVVGALNVQNLEKLYVSGSSNLTIGDLVGMDSTLQYLDVRGMTGKLTLSDAAVDLIKADEDSLNAGQVIDGKDSATDVLEIFDTANVSAADLAGIKNINEIKFSSGNQTEEQVLTLKLNDAVLDGFNTAGTASVANPETVKITLGAGTAPKKVVLDLTDVTTPGQFLLNISAADLVNFQVIDPNGILTPIVVPPSNPVFSIASSTVEEGGTALVTITRDDATDAASITVQTADGTATSPADYTGVGTSIAFAAGELSKTVSIATIDDADVEAAETFTVAITSPTIGTVDAAAGTATVTITDNDVLPPQPVFSIAGATVAEEGGSVVLTITRDITTDAATVQVKTSNGTAVAGQDYTAANKTVSFAAGAATATVSINILNDALPESAETFTATLSNPSIGTIGAAGAATVTITDTDVAGPIDRTVTVTNGTDDAAAGSNTTEDASVDNVTFIIADGIGADFTYTISGFAAGDKIDFEDGFIAPASVTNVDFFDGNVQISAADASGNVATIVLTGVAAENGTTFIVDATTFNNTFGAGSLI
ncbi:DUF4214 domain-containing protein [Thiothrix subterranea]|uniref:Calx-beta domain-containing protein n=1 Tax=Thiothrix subterranea TaxID=2735563 RepID=UPI00192CDAAB|nr:Calx-beta domain-containing protein [Thiothrix subterranea]QQZ29892.1 DUF4214 domain-containing protein [Thiothrix subterranea]